jgi:hypothetical protein
MARTAQLDDRLVPGRQAVQQRVLQLDVAVGHALREPRGPRSLRGKEAGCGPYPSLFPYAHGPSPASAHAAAKEALWVAMLHCVLADQTREQRGRKPSQRCPR